MNINYSSKLNAFLYSIQIKFFLLSPVKFSNMKQLFVETKIASRQEVVSRCLCFPSEIIPNNSITIQNNSTIFSFFVTSHFLHFLLQESNIRREGSIGLTHYLRHWDDVTLNANTPAKFAVISHFVIAQRNGMDYDITDACQMQIGCPHQLGYK